MKAAVTRIVGQVVIIKVSDIIISILCQSMHTHEIPSVP